MVRILLVALAVLVLNLPFGWWRAGVRKFSWSWFLAVHAPIPLVVALRFASGLGFQWYTYPFLVGGFFGGQFLGARLRQRRAVARGG